MPTNRPQLYELEITINALADDAYPARYRVLLQGAYPPDPHLEGNKVIFPPPGTVLDSVEEMIPAEVVNAAMLPRFSPDDKNSAAQLDSIHQDWPFEKIIERMTELTRSLFQPRPQEFLDRLASFTEHLDPSPYANPPSRLGRITLRFDNPALARVPWELMRFGPTPGDELRQRFMMLRRSGAEAGEKSGSFDLPLNVAIRTETSLVEPGQVCDWGKDLFDDFTEDAHRAGGIEWSELGGSSKAGEAHHFIFDSGDMESLSQLMLKVRSIGPGARSLGGWRVPPRLLVLHDVSASLPTYVNAWLVQSALESGADAVLLAALESSDPDTGAFFPTFYRKVMHNWPLDQSLLAAQRAASEKATPVHWVFGAREGGEFGLLLSRAVLEAIQPKAIPKKTRQESPSGRGYAASREESVIDRPSGLAGNESYTHPEPTEPLDSGYKSAEPPDDLVGEERPGRNTRGGMRRGRPARGGTNRGGAARRGGMRGGTGVGDTRGSDLPRQSIPQASERRAARLASSLKDHTERIVKDAGERVFGEAVSRLREISFHAELHGVHEVMAARREVIEPARDFHEGTAALESLAEAEPETVQEAAIRLTNLWLTDDSREAEPRTVTDRDYLVGGKPYQLHLQIGPHREGAISAEVFPDEKLQKVFEQYETITLDVMFFSPDTDFKLEGDELKFAREYEKGSTSSRADVDEEMTDASHGRWGAQASLRLPHYGPSNELAIKITPQRAGRRRIRTCIYYRNVLLQSVLLEAAVVEESQWERLTRVATEESVINARTTDYVASIDFALLDELPQPSLNIFTNHADDGTHWMGVFSSREESAFQLQSGEMRTFGSGQLGKMADKMRSMLIQIEGEKKAYKLKMPLPFKADGTLPLEEVDIEQREDYLCDLAISGRTLYDSLFMSRTDIDDPQRLKSFNSLLKQSHIVSIARCREDSATMPWATLYSEPLATTQTSEISLCGVFKEQLAANRWSADGEVLVDKRDLLDDPVACRSLPNCPLKDPAKRKLTVCPFGFWGFLHQIEQPLQQVKPTPVDEVPGELKNYDFGQTSFLFHSGAEHIKVAVGTYPDIPEVMDHGNEIKALNKATPTLDVVYNDDRDKVMNLLTTGGQHVYYFYCHGEVNEDVFMLKLGPSDKPGYIAAAELDFEEINWPKEPKPLFILNGCETMALLPDVIHGFLGKLKLLGASGIIGTEIKVWTQLARPFGRQLLSHLLQGLSVGEAFLEARRHLLRQYNPLGLVYSYYSPATLHLHEAEGCGWCKSHQLGT